MAKRTKPPIPGIWQGLRWALQPGADGGGTSRARLAWRALRATLWHGKALRRWMTVLVELQSREIVRDLPGEYLRAVRPSVRRGTEFGERVGQLIEHVDWLETAFQPAAFTQLVSGRPVVLAELAPPRGYEFMRLQLEQAPPQSPEGELLLTLNLQRSADVQQKPKPVVVGVLCFSRFRVDATPCLVIGGVRGQRDKVQRVSATEIAQGLQGWTPAVLLVSVAQELARHWGLHLIGLDPAAHRLHGWSYRWNKRYREAGQRVFASYEALWEHFDAKPGPSGWVVVPLSSDEKLAAVALSPEKRERQTRRADYWIRTRNLLRTQFKQLLQRPHREPSLSRVTQAMARESEAQSTDFHDSDHRVPVPALRTGPASLL